MSETLSERMLRWPINIDGDKWNTTLVGISPATVLAWIDGVISLEIERDALRRQVEELLAENRNEPERKPPF